MKRRADMIACSAASEAVYNVRHSNSSETRPRKLAYNICLPLTYRCRPWYTIWTGRTLLTYRTALQIMKCPRMEERTPPSNPLPFPASTTGTQILDPTNYTGELAAKFSRCTHSTLHRVTQITRLSRNTRDVSAPNTHQKPVGQANTNDQAHTNRTECPIYADACHKHLFPNGYPGPNSPSISRFDSWRRRTPALNRRRTANRDWVYHWFRLYRRARPPLAQPLHSTPPLPTELFGHATTF